MFKKIKFFNKKENTIELAEKEEVLDDVLYRQHLQNIELNKEKYRDELIEENKSLIAEAELQMKTDVIAQNMFDLVSKIRMNDLKIKK